MSTDTIIVADRERFRADLLEVLTRAGLILALAVLCFRVFSPFLTVMAWALILAVTLYPLQQWIAMRLGDRQGMAATAVVLAGILLIVVPTAVLISSLGDSVQTAIEKIQNNEVQIPAPRDDIAAWPLVGERIHGVWSQAYTDFPAFVRSMQPKIGDIAKGGLAMVAGIAGGLLGFLAAVLVSGVIMAFGDAGAQACEAIFQRIVGPERGDEFARLATATIRAVAQGVIGVAFIQAIIVGLCLLLAGVPWAGVLAGIVLVLGLAQIPALLVTLPSVVYIWYSGGHATAETITYTVLLLVAGMADNVLKPLMLGRGVEAPMPVILLGALGGMGVGGIQGMFIGATLLALGYQVGKVWVAERSS